MATPLIGRALWVGCGLALVAATAAAQGVPRLDTYQGVAVRILQSNNAGNIHHIIDPTINKVVGLIRGCPNAHNLTTHPDGLYYYCANEQDKTVDVFDTKTLKLVQQIALSERPNKIVVNKKQRKIYAAIVNSPRCSAGFEAAGRPAGRRDRHRDPQGDQEHAGRQDGAQHLRHAGRRLRGGGSSAARFNPASRPSR